MQLITLNQGAATMQVKINDEKINEELISLMPFTLNMIRWGVAEYFSLPDAASNDHSAAMAYLSRRKATLLIKDDQLKFLSEDHDDRAHIACITLGTLVEYERDAWMQAGNLALTFSVD